MHKYIDKSSEQNGRSAVYREDTDAGNMAPHSGYPQEHTQAGGPACSITYVDRYLSIGAHAGRWTSVQYHVRRQIPLNRIPYQPEVQVNASTCTCTGIAAFGVQAFAIGASISDGPVCNNALIH